MNLYTRHRACTALLVLLLVSHFPATHALRRFVGGDNFYAFFDDEIFRVINQLEKQPAGHQVPRKEQPAEPQAPNFTFKNLAGNIPLDVREIVDFIKFPDRFKRLGASMPRGILLVGPPGTGKTSIARAIAGEAQAYFFDATASQFVEVYVGVGPQRVRELFDKARAAVKKGPLKKAIIFIDELDAIGGTRQLGDNTEYRNTLNELLNQMDGFKKDDTILVIAATNIPSAIDSALKRPGRFDRIVKIPLPDEKSRKEIVMLYAQKIKCDQSTINFDAIAAKTTLFSGADLENLVNEAAIRAARQNAECVVQAHFDEVLALLLEKKKHELEDKQRLSY